LYRSLQQTGIDPGLSPEQMLAITRETVRRNLPLLGPGEDYWVMQRVTRGCSVPGGELWQSSDPTVIVECTPLPLKARAQLIRDGVDVLTPTLRRVPPECLDPNIKSHNYLNLVLADREVRDRAENAWAVLLDTRGYLSEGIGSNVFLVKDAVLRTPRERYVLAGVSRQVVLELAESIGIAVQEADLSPHEAVTADEAFITSTSFCICPVRSYDGQPLGGGVVPGPVTRALSDAFGAAAGLDFVRQYLDALEHRPADAAA
jgi:branched-chain amino acid aminotransferase